MREALTVVAASAPAQTAWLKKYGVVTDEIALDLEHACLIAGRLVDEGFLARDVLADLRAIEAIFDEMTSEQGADGARWATAALGDDPGWCRARELAQRVLADWGADIIGLPEICVVRFP